MAFTEFQMLQLCGALGYADGHARAKELVAAVNGPGASEAVSAAGALATSGITALSVDGTKAYTLAAPTVERQRKTIRCVAATNTPLGTVTVSSPDDTAGFVCPATFTFNAVGQALEFEATAALKWRCIKKVRAGTLAGIVGGTTVLTGLSMNRTYSMAVDGTDAGTGTGGLPDGAAVGERCTVVCESAANTPIGSLTGTYVGIAGTAYTTLGTIGVAASATVTGDFAELEWSGSAWKVLTQAGCTLS